MLQILTPPPSYIPPDPPPGLDVSVYYYEAVGRVVGTIVPYYSRARKKVLLFLETQPGNEKSRILLLPHKERGAYAFLYRDCQKKDWKNCNSDLLVYPTFKLPNKRDPQLRLVVIGLAKPSSSLSPGEFHVSGEAAHLRKSIPCPSLYCRRNYNPDAKSQFFRASVAKRSKFWHQNEVFVYGLPLEPHYIDDKRTGRTFYKTICKLEDKTLQFVENAADPIHWIPPYLKITPLQKFNFMRRVLGLPGTYKRLPIRLRSRQVLAQEQAYKDANKPNKKKIPTPSRLLNKQTTDSQKEV